MNAVMTLSEAIRNRRAVRSYTSERVDETLVRDLLMAAVQAPSAMNGQPWMFSIIEDRKQLNRWSDQAKSMLIERASSDAKVRHYAPLLETTSFNIFYDAPMLIVIGAKEKTTFTEADCWLAAENLMLAAADLGLGSCPIGFAIPVLNTAEAKAALGLPPLGAAIAAIIVGHPTTAPPPVSRREPQIARWLR